MYCLDNVLNSFKTECQYVRQERNVLRLYVLIVNSIKSIYDCQEVVALSSQPIVTYNDTH